MKIAFVGCVESSRLALELLLNMPEVEVVAVVTRDQSAVNSDFCDLTYLCKKSKIPYFYEDPKNRAYTEQFLKEFDLDVIYCFGWSYLLSNEILGMTKNGVIGFHPAKLPQNRGRHPIIWTLALGLKETASTFFKMDKGADSGPIIAQKTISITDEDNSETLYSKIMEEALVQIKDFTLQLVNGTANFIEQDHDKATYWRKRSRIDGLIDFRMSAHSIHNLIRALAPPYPCAEFKYRDKFILVSDSEMESRSFPINIEPGKVLEVDGQRILVKCADSCAIWLNELQDDKPMLGDFL